MLFNSLDFAIFLPIVFGLYWLSSRKIKFQNFLICVASYVFYGWWDWRFLSLVLFSTIVDYCVGVLLHKQENNNKRKALLWTSILVNLGFLGFFKYYNFFLDNFVTAFTYFGIEFKGNMLNIILPVGISFYTFQTLSYTIDVYKRKMRPTRNFIAFAAFVSFFPQLVAGPIERASNLLPQFFKKRAFNYDKAADGMRQILWGLFKKVVIADNCAEYANMIFNNSDDYSGSTLLIGALFFAFQIYGDFSGYSDIAIGTARLFGFNLMPNFSFPYFSRDIAEFWRRWHISLSTWFRDYLYIPLGGSRGDMWMKIRNTFIIFVVSGFWHGANWTFIVWGVLNALYFLPIMLFGKNRKNIDIVSRGVLFPNIKEFVHILFTFSLTLLAWVFFRAANVGHGFDYLLGIFDKSLFSLPKVFPMVTIGLILLSIVIEWLQREKNHGLEFSKEDEIMSKPLRWLSYIGIILLIFTFGGTQQDFIYFQF